MKKILKKYIIIFLLLIVIVSFCNNVLAEDSGSSHADKTIDLIKQDWSDKSSTSDGVTNFMTTLVFVVKVIGVAVAIIMLLVIAIKYMTSAPGDKAEIKKHAVVYVVGAVILFAAAGILTIIQQFAEAFNSEE